MARSAPTLTDGVTAEDEFLHGEDLRLLRRELAFTGALTTASLSSHITSATAKARDIAAELGAARGHGQGKAVSLPSDFKGRYADGKGIRSAEL